MSDSFMLEMKGHLDSALRETLGGIQTPGLVVAICDRTGILWHHGRGDADPHGKVPIDLDTLFGTGSVTKTFTAAAILALRDEGALSLDEPLHKSVPEATALRYPTKDSAPITLRHLLTHTSGLPRGVRDLRGKLRREPDERELLEHLASMSLERAPGVERSYSNLGYALLGIVVARRSEKPYDAFVTERILAPLGMNAATFDPAGLGDRLATPYKDRDGVLGPNKLWPHGAYVPVGGLYASTRELARYIGFQLSAWPPRDEPDAGLPLCRATVRESHRVGGLQRVGRNGTGLGWAIERGSVGDVVHHSGGLPVGYSAFAGFEHDVGIGIAGLANADLDLEEPLLRTLGAFAIARGLVEDRRR